MAQPPNVFITWSKERSKAAAIALRRWLPLVIQAVKPWMSETDIDKGTVWLSELAKALAGIKLGIICLAPESLSEAWVLFETGVIFKGLDESRVWTYLLSGLKPSDVPQPLGLFQHTVATEADTFKLLQSINEAMDDRGVSSEILKKQFETYWPDLNKELSSLPAPKAPIPESRSADEMLAEILELLRADERQKIVERARTESVSDLQAAMLSQLIEAKPGETTEAMKEREQRLRKVLRDLSKRDKTTRELIMELNLLREKRRQSGG